MALTSLKSIEKALGLVDAKKENLKKAFEGLQSHSSLLSSLNFTWSDIDSYFTSVQSELLHKFSALQSLEFSQNQKPVKPEKRKSSFLSEPVPARPDLKLLCQSMDGLGLRKYVLDRPKERTAIRVELADAFKHAPDPGSMVLDALEGFWEEKSGSGSRLRTACVVLLEELIRAGVEIGAEVKERAMAVASQWKEKIAAAGGGDGEEEGGLDRLGYLQLLATYKLFAGSGYDVNELIDCVVLSARYRQAVDLCRILGLESIIPAVIQRLISKGKQLLALKFIFDFELTEDYPPVPLLKTYVMDSKKVAQKVSKTWKSSPQSLNDTAMKEISALKSVVKCIEDNNLESQYPKGELVARIEKLEYEKAARKRPAPAPAPAPKRQQHTKQQPRQTGNKKMKPGGGPSPFKRNPPQPQHPSSVKRKGLLPDHAAPYLSLSAGAYGMAAGLAAQYAGPSADVYGLSRAPLGYSGNLNPSPSNPLPTETHAQPSYYDKATGYSGYDVASEYHPVYYPQ